MSQPVVWGCERVVSFGRERKEGGAVRAVAFGAALRVLSLASQSVRHLVSSGFHTIVFNDDKKHEDGHLQIGKMIVTTLKKYEPKIRPYLMLNNIEELDDVLTKHSKNVIFNIDHYLQDESSEILQSVIQNRSYVIGIHYKNRHKKKQTCRIKPNVSNSIDCLNGHLPYLFLYSYIPVWHENDNNFQLTKEEFD